MLTKSRWDYHWADHLGDSVAAYKEATWLSSERYDNDNDDNDDNDNDDNVPPGVTSQRQCQWFVICRNGSQMIFGLKRLLHIFLKKPVLFGRNRRDFTMIFKLVKPFFILASLYMQVEGLNVKVKLTAHGPSLIVLKLTAPRGAIFVSPPGGNIDILLQFYNLSIL